MDMESWEKIGRLAGWSKSASDTTSHELTTTISGWKLPQLYPMLTFEGSIKFVFTKDSYDGQINVIRIDPVDVYAVKSRGKFKIDSGSQFWKALEESISLEAEWPTTDVLYRAFKRKIAMDNVDHRMHRNYYNEDTGVLDMPDHAQLEWEEAYERIYGEEPDDSGTPEDDRFPEL